MSDDEGDYGEAYDDDFDPELGEDGPDELDAAEEEEKEEKEEDVDEEEGEEDEVEAVEEAQAEIEAEAEAEAAEGETAEEEEEPALSKPMAATRIRADPLLRMSNTHRRIIIVPPDERITSNIASIFEATRAIAIRAKQIETAPNMFTEAPGLTDSVARAKKELLDRKSPLILRRTVGRGSSGEIYVEEWPIRLMVIPPLD